MSPAPALPPADRIDWRAVLQPRGPWSALVTVGSSPARVAESAVGAVYLSVPYALEAQIRGTWRVEQSVRASVLAAIEMALLAASGCSAQCPAILMAEVAHARVLVEEAPEPLDQRFWMDWSQPLLNAARVLAIPSLPGWDRCPMVWRDLRHALTYSLPVHVYGGGA